MTPFTDLPAEIRNRIYEYALVTDRTIFTYTYFDLPRPLANLFMEDLEELSQTLAQPALTRTCQSVRAETLPISYGANRSSGFLENVRNYRRHCFEQTMAWLEIIGPVNRELLRRFQAYSSERGKACAILKGKGWSSRVVGFMPLDEDWAGRVLGDAVIRFTGESQGEGEGDGNDDDKQEDGKAANEKEREEKEEGETRDEDEDEDV